ncbi:ATP-dependent DNA ligase [Skermania sp. ID1734]|uniref:DNA polymerase domain-containing protein n=1 Tax=Skermania sp. ID1734 TaxID=2597516 RepID=UPI00117C7571|nr:ATP-dependent DNA ligase [Skermania sp. ID1734]TSD96636.1 ATP-dependent DNA ligase [Skermania sp. ID1734]
MVAQGGEHRAGVALTHLDQPLFDGAEATKRDLIDYLDAIADRIVGELRDRPLSVIRVRPGQQPFMQKNLPDYAPDWIRTTSVWATASRRNVRYALCDDRRTLVWFANQRSVEYHPTLVRADDWQHATHLVLDIDPPEGGPFASAVSAALLVRQALADAGLAGAVKTSGAKGLHIYVPVERGTTIDDAAAATRALAARAERLDPAIATTAFVKSERGGKVFIDSTRVGGASLAAAYSPRIRPGTPVSFPVDWRDLDRIDPQKFTIRNAAQLLGDGDPWAEALPAPQQLPAELLAEGHAIPVARVQAMHEGKRRARQQRAREHE